MEQRGNWRVSDVKGILFNLRSVSAHIPSKERVDADLTNDSIVPNCALLE